MGTEKLFTALTISVTGYYQEWSAQQIESAKKAVLLVSTGNDEADGYKVKANVQRWEA